MRLTFRKSSNKLIRGGSTGVAAAGSWPENAWFLTGGYQISNADEQFVDEPWLTYNAEKDVLIPQMFAPDRSMEAFTGYYKNVKDYNPNIKILSYSSPSVVRKSEVYANGNSLVDYAYRVIVDAGESDWYLYDDAANLLQAKFSFNYTRANWCLQFQTDNSSGRNYAEEYFQQWHDNATTSNANGFMIDYIDGIYIDVAPPSPQEVYDYSSSPRTQSKPDFNNDGTADEDDEETIPDPITNEDGYGGARMERRGMVQWVDAFKGIFGSDFALFRNGTRDGLNYNWPSGGELKASTHAMTDSEFYQKWEGGNNEIIMGSLGIRRNTPNEAYDFVLDGFHIQCRYQARQKACAFPEGTHIWGKYGTHALLCQFNLIDPADITGGVWRAKDYDMARFITGFCRLNGSCTALNVSNQLSFPLMDEDCFPCGDTVDGNPPEMGTYTPSTAVNSNNLDYVLRSPDYESGSADFYWQEFLTADGFNKYIWVLRSDWTGSSGEHGDGTTTDCQLPDPSSGIPGGTKVWKHIDTTSTVTTGIRSTRAQGSTGNANDGGDVKSGGSFGAVALLPAFAVMLVTEDA